MAKFKVLSTKKLEPSLVEKARAANIDIKEQEAIQIRQLLSKEKWEEVFSLLEMKVEYAVFTSSNAVHALRKYLHTYVNYLPVQWKIFCLAGKTKEALVQDEELFGSIEGIANDATALAHDMLAKGIKEVVFFCGNRRRDNLPQILQEQGVQVHEAVVYETIETPLAVEEEYDAVLFFSPSGVSSFFSVNQLKKDAVCFAIGHTTAESLALVTKNKIFISKEPSQEALLNEVILYYNRVAKGLN